MSIVLNENEWAEEMLREKNLGKKPFETLTRIARYYIDSGYKKDEVRDMLERFILQCDSTASIPKWSDSIGYALNKAIKNEAVQISGINITKSEMSIIETLDGIQLQRLAFTLLCLAKYWDATSSSSNHWVNTKDSEIMQLANINTSIKRQSAMYHTLIEHGLIQASKKVDNTNVRVLFCSDDQTAMVIDDYRNLGNQYMMMHSKQYIKCAGCGLVVRRTNIPDTLHKIDYNRQKYCQKCANNIKIRDNVNKIMDVNLYKQ